MKYTPSTVFGMKINYHYDQVSDSSRIVLVDQDLTENILMLISAASGDAGNSGDVNVDYGNLLTVDGDFGKVVNVFG